MGNPIESTDRQPQRAAFARASAALALALAFSPAGAAHAAPRPLPQGAPSANDGERELSPAEALKKMAEFEKSLGYQHGTVKLPGGEVEIVVPKSMHFIPAEGANRVVTEVWGNPPSTAEHVLGMLVPADKSIFEPSSWGVVFEMDHPGHVSDADAASINYDELLASIKTQEQEENKEQIGRAHV